MKYTITHKQSGLKQTSKDSNEIFKTLDRFLKLGYKREDFKIETTN